MYPLDLSQRQSLQEDVPSRGAGPLPPCHREGCSVDCQTPAFWKRSQGPASLASRVCQCLCFTYTRICHRVPCLSKSCFPTICDDRLCMYQWFSPHFRYTGIASIQRQSARHAAGPTKRLHEHLLATIRRDAKDATKLRYRMARRQPPELCMFLVVRRGPEARIRA